MPVDEQSTIEQLQSENDCLREDLHSLHDSVAEKEHECTALKNENAQLRQEVQRLQRAVSQAESTLQISAGALNLVAAQRAG